MLAHLGIVKETYRDGDSKKKHMSVRDVPRYYKIKDRAQVEIPREGGKDLFIVSYKTYRVLSNRRLHEKVLWDGK